VHGQTAEDARRPPRPAGNSRGRSRKRDPKTFCIRWGKEWPEGNVPASDLSKDEPRGGCKKGGGANVNLFLHTHPVGPMIRTEPKNSFTIQGPVSSSRTKPQIGRVTRGRGRTHRQQMLALPTTDGHGVPVQRSCKAELEKRGADQKK